MNSPEKIDGVDTKKREREAGQPAADATCGAMLHWTVKNCESLRAVFFHVLSEYPGVEREAETQEEEQWPLSVLQSG